MAEREPRVKGGKGPGPYSAEMNWSIWEERFDFYIALKGLTAPADEATIKLLFFSELGSCYEELRQLAMPDDVRTKTLAEAKALMQQRFGEIKSVAAKRHELFSARQSSAQSARDFAVILRGLAAKAEWHAGSVDMLLASLFTNGLSSNLIRAELIKSERQTFNEVVELAAILEQSCIDAKQIGTGQSSSMSASRRPPEVARIGNTFNKPGSTGTCGCCGKPGHFFKDCRFKDSKCNICGQIGHWAKMCRKKEPQSQWKPKFGDKQKGGRRINAVDSVLGKSVKMVGY